MNRQFGFDALLEDADRANKARNFEKSAGHLPNKMDEALPFYHQLIERHHEAMVTADVELTMALRKEANNLAIRLNGGTNLGIIADENAPGCVLATKTAAPEGRIPLWGQGGNFIVNVGGMLVRVELNGMFGIGASVGFWPGFSAHIVEEAKPFFSDTGYRSFLGTSAHPVAGLLPDAFAAKMIACHIEGTPGSRKKGMKR